MTTSKHSATTGAIDPSPAQKSLLDDLAAERDRLASLSLRASRLNHVRRSTNAAAALRFARCTIDDALRLLERTERCGSLRFTFTSEGGPVLSYERPPQKVTYLDEYRAKLAAAAR